MSRLRLAAAAAALAAALFAAGASAQSWPDKPVKILVPAPAGSSLDVLARAIGDKLKDKFGQPVVVENKPAAGGTVATAEVARGPADGSVMLLGFNGPLAMPACQNASTSSRVTAENATCVRGDGCAGAPAPIQNCGCSRPKPMKLSWRTSSEMPSGASAAA